MTDQELITYNQRGFIPGPQETELQFLSRIHSQKSTPPHWSREQLLHFYDFSPHNLDLVYSNKHLAPWEGAVCWIDSGKVTLQLRENFRTGPFLGYSEAEVIAHEAVHAARALFDEPENEEFFAYATSSKRWQQVLGPIVRRPWEVWLFLAAMFVGIFWVGGWVLSGGLLGFSVWRLVAQHHRRNRAAKTLMKQLHNEQHVRAALFRMTDAEIRTLAQGKTVSGDQTLRWQLIRAAYFK